MGSSESNETPPQLEFNTPWRNIDWGQKEKLKKRIENFCESNPDISQVRILLVGQVGAGKSNFINSVKSTFQGEIVNEALADATAMGTSFTERLTTYQVINEHGELPFVFSDIMGLESQTLSGLQVGDVISTIFGHVKEDYKYVKDNQINSKDDRYNPKPSVSDQTFCVVYVIAADVVSYMDNQLLEKLGIIRQRISDEGIPQVIVMTKVDEACSLVKNDLRKIYTSKKIKERMGICSAKVGVPMSNIFPIKNYHDEIDTNDDVDVLILKAFDQIVRSATTRVKKGALKD